MPYAIFEKAGKFLYRICKDENDKNILFADRTSLYKAVEITQAQYDSIKYETAEITGIDDNLTTPVFTTVDPVPSFNLEVNNSSKQIALETIENHINGASNSDFINRLNTFKNYLDNLDVSSLMDKDSENNPIASSKNLFKLIDDNNQESIHYIQIG